MNLIQKYVLNSLFERNQITEEKLAQALDAFSNEPAIDSFLSVLITGQKEEIQLEEFSPEWNLRYYKQFIITWSDTDFSKVNMIGIIKNIFGINLKTAKDIVDSSVDNVVTIPREVSEACCIFKHKVEEIKCELENMGLQVEVVTKLN